jgi:hypothetical protein
MFCNYFYVLMRPDTTRISFGEALTPENPLYRIAMVMPTSDAIELGRLILKLATPPEGDAATASPDLQNGSPEK